MDTAVLIAMGNTNDAFHREACIIRDRLREDGRRMLTTNTVLMEFGNAFSPVRLRPTAIRFIETIRKSGKWTCVPVDEPLLSKGFQLYRSMQDKSWGLVDCISIVVATDNDVLNH